MRSKEIQKSASSDDRDGFICSKFEKVFISGDDVICSRGKGTFQYFVVIRIICDNMKSLFRGGEISKFIDKVAKLLCFFVRPVKVIFQYATQFTQDFPGNTQNSPSSHLS